MQKPPSMFFPKLLRWSYLRNLESYLMRFPNPVSMGFFSKHGGENAEMRCVCWATRMVQSHGASSGTYQNYIYIYLYLFIFHLFTINPRSRVIYVSALQLHRPFLFSPHACLKSERKRNNNNFCADIIIRWQKKGRASTSEAWNENRSQTCCVDAAPQLQRYTRQCKKNDK